MARYRWTYERSILEQPASKLLCHLAEAARREASSLVYTSVRRQTLWSTSWEVRSAVAKINCCIVHVRTCSTADADVPVSLFLTQRCSALTTTTTKVATDVQSDLRSKNFYLLIAAAGQRLYSHASEGLRPQGPLSGTKLGPSGSGDSIMESGDLSSGILKSRATGKAGLSKDESEHKHAPFTDTEETDELAATEGVEGPSDFARQVKENDEANTASIKEEARKSPEEFKSDLT